MTAKKPKHGGRVAGTPNRVTAATRERIEREGDPIGFLLNVMNGKPIKASPSKDGTEGVDVYPTADQRISAAQTLARKIIADARDRAVTFDAPKIETVDDAMKAIGSVLGAVAAGQVTPGEGQQIAAIVEAFRKIVETHELERRIGQLETQQGAGT